MSFFLIFFLLWFLLFSCWYTLYLTSDEKWKKKWMLWEKKFKTFKRMFFPKGTDWSIIGCFYFSRLFTVPYFSVRYISPMQDPALCVSCCHRWHSVHMKPSWLHVQVTLGPDGLTRKSRGLWTVRIYSTRFQPCTNQLQISGTRVAGKGNVAVNIGIIMMMLLPTITLHRMMVEELTRQKETEERHKLLKMVRMELMTKVARAVWEQVTTKIIATSNGVGWINVSILIENPVRYNRSSFSKSTGLSIKFLLDFFMPGGFMSVRLSSYWVVLNKTWHVHSPYCFVRSSRSLSLYQYRRLS